MSEAISIENQKIPVTEIFEKEGYKKTKLGCIPEDWSVKSLGEIGVFSKGKGISKSEITETGLACVRYAEIYTKYNNYTYSFNSFINRTSAENSRTIESGDILFAGSGETLEDIGKCITYLGKETVYAGGDIIVLKPKSDNSKYLSFVLNHTVANKQKHKLGQGHSVVHIYSSSLKNLKIPLPPLPEQEKIAAILSTWDNSIGKQEQLIAAKQHYKKGLMQLLLTGKKRFEAFDEEWKEVRLKQILKYEQPTKYIVQETNYKNIFNIPVLTANKSFILGYTNEDFGIYLENLPVIIFDDFTTDNKWVDFPFKVKSSAMKILKLSSKNFDLRYIYERMQLLNFEHTDHKRYYISEYQYLKFDCPSFKEQQKISSVLSKADLEIALLQDQLTQLQTQKRGLMQKLLTGAVRVKI